MYQLIRPLLFTLPPALAHSVAMAALAPVEHVTLLRRIVHAMFAVDRPELKTRVMGLDFPNPIGLAGGFDKNARRARALAALGFGYLELGTVTARAQEPNPAPNLFRLPADRALINRLGFPNEGADPVTARVQRIRRGVPVPVGISIGKSRSVPLEPVHGMVADYLSSFRAARTQADFVVVNVSSPNTAGLRAMQGQELARTLLGALQAENKAGTRVPLLVKIAPDLDQQELEALLDVGVECDLDGVVATNTTIARTGLSTDDAAVAAMGAGGLSGPPLRERSRQIVQRVRARLGPKRAVIGVGGIESADDVLAMMRAGADLVQLYTSFIYRGPGIVHSLARALADAAAQSGAVSLAELTRTAWPSEGYAPAPSPRSPASAPR
ncbi:quinone-dependent dihydroorotate dehydrogenase [Pendulispora albinea]|uniref:Dihydroorotate dehydrogenase (quinone) n=1 Tax=Pendulispora albinea TaxID=2741071 RepID=A0ABZ2LXL7_9BACT